MQPADDTVLISASLDGDQRAFSSLIDHYKGAVYAVALSIIKDFDAAEDIVQETFIKAYLHLSTLDEPARFGNWLRIIAANQARTWLRRQRREAALMSAVDQIPGPHWADHLGSQEEAARSQLALEALSQLPEKDRQLLTLYYLGGHRVEEVGTLLGISGPTAKMQLHRARQRLKKEALAMIEHALPQQQPESASRLRFAQVTVLGADLGGGNRSGKWEVGGAAALAREAGEVEAAQFLCEYRNLLADLLLKHGGTLDRFDGSRAVAFFGHPAAQEDHARRACLAALEMQERMAAWKPEAGFACGLSSGQVLVGDMGSRHRAEYTIAGEAVELAARLEKLARKFGATVAISGSTCAVAAEAVEVRELDRITFAGAREPVTVYELLGRRGELEGERAERAQLYTRGLEHYKRGEWAEALGYFDQTVKDPYNPVDWASQRYRSRCWMRMETPRFERLSQVPKEEMECLLREVEHGDLQIAIRETEPQVKEGFFRVMSRRVRRFMEEEMDALELTSYSKEEIAAKQQKILQIAGWLARQGKISVDLGPETLDPQAVMAKVREQLAADCGCDPALWDGQKVSILVAGEHEGKRRFPWRERSLTLVTMGRGVVITCDEGRLAWAREHLGHLDRDTLYSAPTLAQMQAYVARDGQLLAGPELKYVCSRDRLRPLPFTSGLPLELVEEEGIAALYPHREFRHALGFDPGSPRPDVLAWVARAGDEIGGIAGASADSDSFWQIGVEVRPEYRGRGVGQELVHHLTRAVLERGKVPYYSTLASNLTSNTIAVKLGYWPAWVEVYAREQA